jgi:enediyne biosynthesis protein E4
MSRLFLIIVALVVLAGLLVGGYLGVKWLRKPASSATPLDPGKPHERQARAVPAITFTDVTPTSGVRFQHQNGYSGLKLLPETMGGGVAIIDYDGDGKPDILLVSGRIWPGHEPPSAELPPQRSLRLYHNLGDMKFADVTDAVGLNVVLYGMGVTVGDFDNDGRPDIFVSCVGKHHLFRNVDGKTFTDVTDTAGVGGMIDLPKATKDAFANWKEPIPFGSSCTFLDYDGDGKLDLFVCHYVTWSPGIDRGIASSVEGGKRTFVQPRDFEGSQCTLYRNVDGKRFEDVSAQVGIVVTEKEGTDVNGRLRPVGKALGVVACDVDGDGWPDLIVANDTVRNFFFHNVPGPNGTRRFEEKGYPLGAAYADEGKPRGGMGVDWGEFALGRSAAVIANFANEPLTLLEKDRTRLAFSDSALSTGLAGPSRSALKFGTLFFDYDNDGRLDLLVCNGHIEPEIASVQASQTHAQPPQLYWNTGDADCYFEQVPPSRAGTDLFKPMVGRGCAFADLDGDGDLDLILVANGGAARILRNDAPTTNHSVRLDLRGDGVKSNRSAIGAVVTVEAGGQAITRHMIGGRGYLSQSELLLTVGIGAATKADKVTVRWPGKAGGAETWTNLDAGRTHVLKQGESK